MSLAGRIKNFTSRIIKRIPREIKFKSHLHQYNNLNTRPEFQALPQHFYKCLQDWDAQAGSLGYYFWQDLWAAKKIFENKPAEHFDIGSRVDGFIAHVLSFNMPVTMIDIRPLDDNDLIENLKFIQSDATNLENIPDNSINSLSSLCAPEHFGLGRYGDSIAPEGCFKAFKSMQRVLSKGGHLYIAVPVGDRSGVAFNAHRIFEPSLVVDTLNELKLADFTIVDTRSGKQTRFIEHADYKNLQAIDIGMDYKAGVDGLFEFVK